MRIEETDQVPMTDDPDRPAVTPGNQGAGGVPDPPPPDTQGPNPITQEDEEEMEPIPNEQLLSGILPPEEDSPFEALDRITGHKFLDGVLHFTVL